MEDSESENPTRRSFLQTSAAIILGSAVTACGEQQGGQLPNPTEKQRAQKRQGSSRVLISTVESYDVLLKQMEDSWKTLGFAVKNKSVFLKVNLVDYREEIPVCTNPAFLAAAIEVVKNAGAKHIKVGDGPALYRDTEQIVRASGMEAVCKKAGVEFIDLNIDDLEKVENPMNFTGIPEFLLPHSITSADTVISLPKLKTHHWALMTCSMKNMFGVIPGRKYGWPKNLLHIRGINSSIIDVVATVKPAFAMVDGIVGMEGDGPLNGCARELHALIMGEDLCAVDTVAGLCMDLPVHNIPYLQLAGMVLGNNKIEQIEVLGTQIQSIKQKFQLPPTYEVDGSPKNLSALSKGSESGVT